MGYSPQTMPYARPPGYNPPIPGPYAISRLSPATNPGIPSSSNTIAPPPAYVPSPLSISESSVITPQKRRRKRKKEAKESKSINNQ